MGLIVGLLCWAGCAPAVEPSGKEGLLPPANRTSSLPATNAGPASEAWPLFRGDGQATGVAPGSLPEKLEPLWTFSVEDGGFESTAAIADGMVYVGCTDGRLCISFS